MPKRIKIKFHEYAQKIRPRTVRRDKQEDFIKHLFYHAGVEGYQDGDTIDLDNYSDEYLRKIYTGNRAFSQKVKDEFLKPVPRDNVISFFQQYIDSYNLDSTMQRFFVPEICPREKDLFFDALCTQLDYLVCAMEESVEDIVVSEYVRLPQNHKPLELEKASGILLTDLDKLSEIIEKIRDVAILLENFDIENSNSPLHDLLTSIKGINETMPSTEFTHKATSNAVQEFYNEQDDMIQFLSKVTAIHDYKAYSHSGSTAPTKNDALYTVAVVQNIRRSLYSAVNNVIHAESVLLEEFMLLTSYVPTKTRL